MQHLLISVLLAGAAVTTACVLPTDTLSNNITDGFGILIQNPEYPAIHDQYMMLDPAGGGDMHWFVGGSPPVGNSAFNLVLSEGVLEQGVIHAVIDGEYDPVANTTKIFMTERTDYLAYFTPVYACDPDNDEVQIILAFQGREDFGDGGLICVRPSYDNSYEFRYSPPGNTAVDPGQCIPVTMVVVPASEQSTYPTSGASSSTSSLAQSAPSTTSTTSTTFVTSSTSSSATATATLQHKPVVGPYSFLGCYTEATTGRALSAKSSYDYPAMTIEECEADCIGYTYFGVEYGGECYCGNTINAGSVLAALTDCDFICPGNPYEYCGAGLRLEMYELGSAIVSTTSSSSSSSSSIISTSTSSTAASSASSSTTASSTPSSSSSSSSSIISTSTSSAASSSTSSSATASSTPSSSFSSSSSIISTSTSSTTSSSTSSSSTVPTLQHKPTVGPYSFLGCYTEATTGRALSAKSSYDYPAMTIEECEADCIGYTYFGVEYGGECYCGNIINAGSVLTALNDCSFICPGNSYEYCGAGSRLEMYELGSAIGSTPLPYTDMTANGFSFVGCAPEASNADDGPARTLTGTLYADNAMTDEECMAFCSSEWYTFAGTEYTRECWCGNSVAPGREPQTTIASLANCNYPCGGNAAQFCGGSSWLSLYKACTAGSPCVNAQFT